LSQRHISSPTDVGYIPDVDITFGPIRSVLAGVHRAQLILAVPNGFNNFGG